MKIGIIFATLDKRDIWKRVDRRPTVELGTSEEQLERLCHRRNRIAPTGDRDGHKRATLETEDVETDLANARDVVQALETAL